MTTQNINKVVIAVEEHKQHLEQLGAGVAIGGDGEGLAVAALPPKQTVAQKNALQDAVRVCLKVFTQIMDSEALPQPLENGQYWEATTMVDPKLGDEMKAHLAELDVYIEEYRIENNKKTKGGVHLPRCHSEDHQDLELPSLRGATVNCLLIRAA
ncbi:hypothetical protein VTO73DRAFT_9642 [Trametes versicolor]